MFYVYLLFTKPIIISMLLRHDIYLSLFVDITFIFPKLVKSLHFDRDCSQPGVKDTFFRSDLRTVRAT